MKKALAAVPPNSVDSVTYDKIQSEIRVAEVDLQYCLNFPWTKEYERLFSDATTDDVLHGSRQPLWDVVEQCMMDGTLDDLRTGALDNTLAENGIKLLPRESPDERMHPEAVVLHESKVIEKANASTLQGVGDTRDEEEVRSNVLQYVQPSPIIPSDNHDPELEVPVHSKMELSPGPKPESHAYDNSEEEEGGVVINLNLNDQEGGEISENSAQANGSSEEEEPSLGDGQQEYPVDIRGGSDSGPDDAMLEYSNADQAIDRGQSKPQLDIQSYQPSTLAELNEEDLREQVKYFYLTQELRAIDFGATPVRCLVCSKEGHMAANCPRLSCADCGQYNDHFPPFCPVTKRCPRCRQSGHDEDHCKSRLRILSSEIICDLCSKSGHTEDDCELVWRTSGLPAAISETKNRVKHMFCYECGGRSHLGNDCPTKRPGKPIGTSTWSSDQVASQLSIRSKGEMSIKGRAQQQQPVPIASTSDDERESFVRPKVPAPTKTGQIRIQAPRQNVDDSNWKPPSSRYTQDQGYSSFRPSDQYPMSPHYGGNGYDSRAYAYQPPLPQEPLPSRGKGYSSHYSDRGESFHPMPSARQNAWRQFRM